MTPQILAAAKKSVLLHGVSDDLAQQVLQGATQRKYAMGETIFVQGDPANAVFIIIEGWVKLFRLASNGAEAVVSVLPHSRSFGENVALRGLAYPVSAEAISDSTLLQIDAARLRKMVMENPDFALSLLGSVFVHMQQLVAQVEQLKARSGVQRVAEFLVDLAQDDDDGPTVQLPYNKNLIAGHLGMQPESLSRAFAKLREHGVQVETNKAHIADLEALRDLANEDRSKAWNK